MVEGVELVKGCRSEPFDEGEIGRVRGDRGGDARHHIALVEGDVGEKKRHLWQRRGDESVARDVSDDREGICFEGGERGKSNSLLRFQKPRLYLTGTPMSLPHFASRASTSTKSSDKPSSEARLL